MGFFDRITGIFHRPSDMSDIQELLQIIKRSHQRYQKTSDSAALDDAVVASERILSSPDLLRAEPSLMAAARNSAGGLYLQRYWARGKESDLNRALGLFRQAVAATLPGHPNLAGYLSNLGIGLSNRFGRTGRQEDLEEAIRVFRQAVQATPPGHPNLAAVLNNLGNRLSNLA